MPERLVVIGGDAGGMSAAAQARRRRPRAEMEVIAYERGGYTSYSACGLPYYVAGEISDVEKLVARSPEEHRAQGIDVRLNHEVLAIDLDARTVTVVDHNEGFTERTERFDKLVIATGAAPVRPALPGVDRAACTASRPSTTASTSTTTCPSTTARLSSGAATSDSRWPRR